MRAWSAGSRGVRGSLGTWGTVVALAIAAVPDAQCPVDDWSPSGAVADDEFGASAVVEGDTAFVGAEGVDAETGLVYWYERDDGGTPADPLDDAWIERGQLRSPLVGPPDRFGAALALWKGTLVVGAPDYGAGQAFVYERDDRGTPDPGDDAWVETFALSPGVSVGYFGRSVSVCENTIVVGTREGNKAFVYERIDAGRLLDPLDDVWQQTAQLVAGDGGPGPGLSFSYGWSVSIRGDTVLVSARRDDEVVGNSGSIYVYLRDDRATFDRLDDLWVERPKLVAADPAPDAQMGRQVRQSGDTLVAGAFGGSGPTGVQAGSAHVFQRDRRGTPDPLDDVWVETAKLVPLDGAPDDRFGGFVDIDGPTILVGAPSQDEANTNAGAVYVFEREDPNATPLDPFDDEWVWTSKVLPAAPLANGEMSRVALWHTTALAGAPGQPDATAIPGSVEFFGVGQGCLIHELGRGVAGTGGFTPHVSASGVPRLGHRVRIEVTAGLGSAPGYLVAGTRLTLEPVLAGTLYATPPFVLFHAHVLGGTPGLAGAGTCSESVLLPLSLDLVNTRFYFQAMYLDEGAPGSGSLSNAVRVTVSDDVGRQAGEPLGSYASSEPFEPAPQEGP